MGVTSDALSSWPGVGGVVWARRSVSAPEASSHSLSMRTSGVPAWPYQRKKRDRSRPDARSKDDRKSSTVTAWPSKVSK